MKTTTAHLMHLMIALGTLVLAMTTAFRIVPPAPVENELPAGVVVDDGVPF